MAQKNIPFTGPQLQQSDFAKADMTGTCFNCVNLTDARFFTVQTNARFSDCNMTTIEFDDVNLSGSMFNNVTMSNAVLDDINMAGVRISNANLVNLELAGVNLDGMKCDDVLVTDLLDTYRRRRGSSRALVTDGHNE